jgi:hypothetical protein
MKQLTAVKTASEAEDKDEKWLQETNDSVQFLKKCYETHVEPLGKDTTYVPAYVFLQINGQPKNELKYTYGNYTIHMSGKQTAKKINYAHFTNITVTVEGKVIYQSN